MNKNANVVGCKTTTTGNTKYIKSFGTDGTAATESNTAIFAVGFATGYVKAHFDVAQKYLYTTIKKNINYSDDFEKLKNEWEEDTAVISNLNKIAMHPSYQRIIGMGATVVPLIIREMTKKPGYWFWALKAITGEDPVPAETRGNIKQMTDSWLEWWEENQENYE